MEPLVSKKISWNDFLKVDMRVGTIITAEIFKEAKKPAYKMSVDFGELGQRKTSAQITTLYKPEELVGKQIIAVLNFETKQIANIMSECLILGLVDTKNEVTLITPERKIKNGTKLG